MRVIGLDYGTKTVGVALSDALGITAQPVETITRKEENKLRKIFVFFVLFFCLKRLSVRMM